MAKQRNEMALSLSAFMLLEVFYSDIPAGGVQIEFRTASIYVALCFVGNEFPLYRYWEVGLDTPSASGCVEMECLARWKFRDYGSSGSPEIGVLLDPDWKCGVDIAAAGFCVGRAMHIN